MGRSRQVRNQASRQTNQDQAGGVVTDIRQVSLGTKQAGGRHQTGNPRENSIECCCEGEETINIGSCVAVAFMSGEVIGRKAGQVGELCVA